MEQILFQMMRILVTSAIKHLEFTQKIIKKLLKIEKE